MSMSQTVSPAALGQGQPGRVINPRLSDRVELLGPMRDVGFTEPQFLLRGPDGQYCRVSGLLYHLADAADGSRDLASIARYVSRRIGKPVSGDNVAWLIGKRLGPLMETTGLAQADDVTLPTARDGLLSLRIRKPLLSAQVMNWLATPLQVLYSVPAIVVVMGSALALNWWMFQGGGFDGALQESFSNPLGPLAVVAFILAGTFFHEVGHATALKRGGGRPGVMGVGLYLAWPAFYTDVTDAYRLSRWKRVRVDLGGIYFNVIFALALFGVYLATDFKPLLFIVLLMELEATHQLLPLVRLDGYYLLADLVGVPDLFAHIKPFVNRLLGRDGGRDSASVLRRGPGIAFTVYALTIVPAMIFFLVLLMMKAPDIYRTALGAENDALGNLRLAALEGDELSAITILFQLAVLLLGPLAITLSLFFFFRRTALQIWGWGARSFARGMMATALSAAIVGTLSYVWIPREVWTRLPTRMTEIRDHVQVEIEQLKNRDDPTVRLDRAPDRPQTGTVGNAGEPSTTGPPASGTP